MNTIFSTMKHFSCLGSQCPDSCCSSWSIPLDEKATKFLFNAAENQLFGALSFEDIVRLEGEDMVHAYLRHNKDSNMCTLLDTDALCMVHRHHGPENLPENCAVYPRKLMVLGEHTEESGHLSCPAVAQQLLMSPNQPTLQEQEVLPTYQPNHHIRRRTPYSGYVIAIRELLCRFVQNDSRNGLSQAVFFCQGSANFFHETITIFPQKAIRSLHKTASKVSPAPFTVQEEERLYTLFQVTVDFLRDVPFHASLKKYVDMGQQPSWKLLRAILTAERPIYKQWLIRVFYNYLHTTPFIAYPNLHRYMHVGLLQLWVLVVVHAHHANLSAEEHTCWEELVRGTSKTMRVLEHSPTVEKQLQGLIPLSDTQLLSRIFCSFSAETDAERRSSLG